MSNHKGARCPYDELAPRTLEGWQVWELLRDGAAQLRVAGKGAVIGVDIQALRHIAQWQGSDLVAAVRLLSFAEAGMTAAMSRGQAS